MQDPDLFWALKGGGGGTFGAITRLTLATHPLPENFGAIDLTIHAKSDDAFRRLLARFVELYPGEPDQSALRRAGARHAQQPALASRWCSRASGRPRRAPRSSR